MPVFLLPSPRSFLPSSPSFSSIFLKKVEDQIRGTPEAKTEKQKKEFAAAKPSAWGEADAERNCYRDLSPFFYKKERKSKRGFLHEQRWKEKRKNDYARYRLKGMRMCYRWRKMPGT